MTILLFILVLVALIVVHEFGHFIAAKWSGMRVDEFGIGYPPKAWGKKIGETEYTLNWLPFGGFVRIYGEDDEAVARDPKDGERAFFKKPRAIQMLVLSAGILMNLLFAYLLLTIVLAIGAPRAIDPSEVGTVRDAYVLVSGVREGTPAEEAGMKPGDRVVAVSAGEETYTGADSESFTAFIQSAEGPLTMTLEQQGVERTITATPREGLVVEDPERKVLGVEVATVGTVVTPLWQAPIDAAVLTWDLTRETAIGLVKFFGGILSFTADLSQVSGPVGIAGAVGQAAGTGIAPLLTLTALISINLALINLLPIPALDGGRLFFVIIESIIRRPLPRVFQNAVNLIGFAFLILLMLVVTANDIFRITM